MCCSFDSINDCRDRSSAVPAPWRVVRAWRSANFVPVTVDRLMYMCGMCTADMGSNTFVFEYLNTFEKVFVFNV